MSERYNFKDESASASASCFWGENYDYLAVGIKHFLLAYDILETVENGYVTCRSKVETNQIIFKEFIETLQKYCLSFFTAISEDIFSRLVSFVTAKKVWDYLIEEYASSEQVKFVKTLNVEFELLKLEDAKTIKEYSYKSNKSGESN